MGKRTLAIIQARMSSTRLPGKVLKELCGQPILYHIIQRIKNVKDVGEVVVATSKNKLDDAIVEFLQAHQIPCVRGSEEDVLERFAQVAQIFDLGPEDVIVRLTADNPFVDPDICRKLLSYFDKNPFDYAVTARYPLGVGTEVFTVQALQEADRYARKAYEREHVTPFMYRPGQICGKLHSPVDYSSMRLTVDTPEDYQVAQKLYNALYCSKRDFGLPEIVDYLKNNPDVAAVNQCVHQNRLGE